MGCLASICLPSETNAIQLDYTKHDTEYCHFRTHIFYTYSILTQGTILMCNIAQDRIGFARSMPQFLGHAWNSESNRLLETNETAAAV